MNIYERMHAGEWVNRLTDTEYSTTAKAEMQRSLDVCFRLNTTPPSSPEIRDLLDELFEGRLPASSVLTPPMEIDRAKCLTVGENVFINHGFTCMGRIASRYLPSFALQNSHIIYSEQRKLRVDAHAPKAQTSITSNRQTERSDVLVRGR